MKQIHCQSSFRQQVQLTGTKTMDHRCYRCRSVIEFMFNSTVLTSIIWLIILSHTPVALSMTVDPPPQKLNDANNNNMNNAAAATVSASVHCAASKAKIAVIGAGAAGLAAARVATRNSDTDGSSSIVTVFEADPNKVGGIWQYEPQSKSKPMYAGLRTNLPKEVMQYREKPWTQPTDASFLRHDQVASYLEDYTRTFNLLPFIRFGSTVKQLTLAGLDDDDNVSLLSPRNERWPKVRMCWDTRTDDNDDSQSSSSSSSSDIFDAVFICNGHYAAPSTPNLPGLTEYFRGRTMHSVAYDDPKDFSGQTVLCVGGRASGSDLAREISFFADKVYLSDTTCSNPSWINGCEDEPRSSDQSTCPVIWVPKTVSVRQDGTIQFEGCDDEMNPMVDTIVFCSGYDYSFPFINDKSNVDLSVVPGERRVAPLYEQLWHARYPNIAFLGLPHSVVPFPLVELQAEATWVQWNANKFCLPPVEERLEAASVDATSGGAKKNGRIQDTHYLGDAQWEYSRRVAKLAGIYDDSVEAYIATNKQIYDCAGKARADLQPGGPDTYRSLVFQRDQNKGTFSVKAPAGNEVSVEISRAVSQ